MSVTSYEESWTTKKSSSDVQEMLRTDQNISQYTWNFHIE